LTVELTPLKILKPVIVPETPMMRSGVMLQ
jgi:hypothetical protein